VAVPVPARAERRGWAVVPLRGTHPEIALRHTAGWSPIAASADFRVEAPYSPQWTIYAEPEFLPRASCGR